MDASRQGTAPKEEQGEIEEETEVRDITTEPTGELENIIEDSCNGRTLGTFTHSENVDKGKNAKRIEYRGSHNNLQERLSGNSSKLYRDVT